MRKGSLFWAFILFSLSLFFAFPARKVDASPTVDRISGLDRYLTAVAVSQKGWPDGADTVILTTGENYPDALSAAPLAQKYKAPILLTDSKTFNPDTAAELKRLGAKKVIILGGIGAVSPDIERQLVLMGITSTRIAGVDRYETSLLAAEKIGFSKGLFIVNGEGFSDAISAAPIAATLGMPILLVPHDDITPEEKSLLGKMKIQNVYIVNGDPAMSNQVYGEPVYKSDVLKINYLDLSGKAISDLTGLEAFTNLQYLDLGSNSTLTSAKLSPITKLPNLKTLNLSNIKGIVDVSSLKNLSKLEVLDLRYDGIRDFTPLKSLTSLKQLYLKYNDSTDYGALKPIYNSLLAKDFTID